MIALCSTLLDLWRCVTASDEATLVNSKTGITAGLNGWGADVTWEAKPLSFKQRLTSRIRAFDRPFRFRESQVRERFARFDHARLFRHPKENTTISVDVFDDSLFDLIGKLADALSLRPRKDRFLRTRAIAITAAVEQGDRSRNE